HNRKTRLGALLNELGDVVSDAALYLPVALVPGFSPPLIVVLVVLAIIGEMAGVIGEQIGGGRRYDGPLGKSDRALVFGALGLLLGCGMSPGQWLDVVLAVLIVLAALTIINRAYRALRVANLESQP